MRQLLIPISEIEVPDRARLDYGDLESLKISIREHGLIQPIAVKPLETGYKLLAGGRRIRACTELGMTEIPCRVYQRSLLELDEKAIELAENLDRKDFDWKEKIKLEEKIHNLQLAIHGEKVSSQPDAAGWSLRDTARLIGKSPATVSTDLGLVRAMTLMPELAGCKTKDDAEKMLRQIQDNMIKAELASRYDPAKSTHPDDAKRASLINSYIVKDAFVGLSNISNGQIQYCDCDPDYGIGFVKRSNLELSDYQEADKKTYEDYLGTLLSECYRVMAKNSWLTLWFGIDPWAEVVYQTLLKTGFKTNRVYAIWHKLRSPHHSSQPFTNLGSAYDAFYYARKGDAVLFRQGQSNLFSYPAVPVKTHPAEKPIELMNHVISLFTLPGCSTLVPFAGSGNSLLAATNLSCPTAGFDLSENYKNDFRLKVISHPFGGYTSYGPSQSAQSMATPTLTPAGA